MITIRKLLPTEFSLYAEHLLSLETVDRYSWCSGSVSCEIISRRIEKLDWSRVVLIGAFDGNRLAGVAELCTDRAFWPGNAELALSVDRSVQGCGIGGRLARRALTVARNRGISSVHMLCLSSNRRIQALGRRFGGTVTVEMGGDATIVFELAPPDQFSLTQEALDNGAGLIGAVFNALTPKATAAATATAMTMAAPIAALAA
jgi:GNAT superfamily N-acetyltransferase